MLRLPITAFIATFMAGAPLAAAQHVNGEAPRDAVAVLERMIRAHATDAVIWAMPAVNYQLMYEAMVRDAGGAFNQVVYWSGLPDWKNQTLTPNPDAIYLMPFFDTREVGPVVIEIPTAEGGSITGTIMDSWQVPLADVGPAGTDAGKGGKYVILPPDYGGDVPEGYIALPSVTDRGYALLRSILASGNPADVANAVAYGKRIKLYPLSAAADPPETTYVDALGVVYEATIPSDLRFFEVLDRFVQDERWLTRDKLMIEPLTSLGIEKGKPFAPDAATKAELAAAASDAHALLEHHYQTDFEPYFPGRHWVLPASARYLAAAQSGYIGDDYPVVDRGVVFSFAFFTPKTLGTGSSYLMATADSAGDPLDGSKTYRLSVPANVPASQYWSATLYDRETHGLIRGKDRPSRSSQSPDLKANADGSVDLTFGPTPPDGAEGNWVLTDPEGKFEVLFRFYGPQKALFDKTWVLPDIRGSDGP